MSTARTKFQRRLNLLLSQFQVWVQFGGTSYEDRVARGDRAGCPVIYSRRARSTCRNGAGPQREATQGAGERRERPWRQTAL